MQEIAHVVFNDEDDVIIIKTDANRNLLQLKDRYYRYDNIQSYEFVENKTSTESGKVGSTLIGGALFGTTGAILGSSGKRTIDTKIEDMCVLITFNVGGNIKVETVVINIDALFGGLTYGSGRYQKYYAIAKQLMNKLEQIIMNREVNVSSPQIQTDYSQNTVLDLKRELLQLKELFDEGLIDEDEFKNEKQKLLDRSRDSNTTRNTIASNNVLPEKVVNTKQDERFTAGIYTILVRRSKKVLLGKKHKETIDKAIATLNDIQVCLEEDADINNGKQEFQSMVLAKLQAMIEGIAKKNKSVGTCESNREIYNFAKDLIQNCTKDDELLFAVDDSLMFHKFKKGFAIGKKNLYIIDVNKQVRFFPFSEEFIFTPFEKGSDCWAVNRNGDNIIEYFGMIRTDDMAVAVATIIARNKFFNSESIMIVDRLQ